MKANYSKPFATNTASHEVRVLQEVSAMTNQSTINKLIEMRLTAMSDAFRNQLNDTKMTDVPF